MIRTRFLKRPVVAPASDLTLTVFDSAAGEIIPVDTLTITKTLTITLI